MSAYEEDDGLSSFDLRQLGGKVGAFGGAKLLKFAQGDFIVPREARKIGPEREFITFGLIKAVQKFVNKQLIGTAIIAPHANFPDIQAMNEAAPKDEWGVFNGQPQGPFTHALILKFLDAKTFDRYAFVTNSQGGGVAVGDLTAKCAIARRINGPNVTAVVTCHSILWSTKFNPHGKRPDFRVERWIPLDGNKQLTKLAETPKSITSTEPSTSTAEAEASPPIAPAPATDPTATLSTTGPSGLSIKTVPAPRRAQELDDEVPFSSGNES